MHRKFLVILVPNGLQLLLLITVLVNLRLELTHQPLYSALQFFNLWLLEIKKLAFKLLRLVLVDLSSGHIVDSLAELLQLWFVQHDLLAAVALLLLELDCVGLACHLLRHGGSHCLACCLHPLYQSVLHGALHAHLLRHRRRLLKFVVDGLNDLEER